MVNWYMKGQSNYDDSGYFMWLYLDHNGFAEGNYGSQVMETHGETSDPFMAFGVDTGPVTWTYGQQQVEIGLLKSHRIKIDTTGIFVWAGPGQDDWNVLTGGTHALDAHSDVVIDGTPADNEVLAWDNGSSKWINQTPAEAGLSATGHNHNLNDLAEKSHASLSNVTPTQHHTKWTTGDTEGVITAEIVGGQSIDNAIDSLIANHKGGASEHHAKYTNGEADTRADARIITQNTHPAGTIDVAVDALILTHKNINNAHHAVYTNADAVAAVLAGDDYLKLVGDTMGGAINMGANEINNASNYKVDAGDGNGLRFWDGSSSYSIYMSQQTDGTYGGRADSTSDYNIYFNITGDGVNRGFQFCDGLQNPYFAITPDDGVFSDVPLTMNSNIIMNANLITNSTGITFTDNVNSAITLEDHFTTDHRYHGTVIDIENGNLGFGLPGYISGDNAVAQADCDDASKMPCMGISVGDNKMLKSGIIYDLTYGIAGFAHGDVIYVSDAGILTKNRPGNAGDLIQVIGVMIDASTLDVHISLDMVEFV